MSEQRRIYRKVSMAEFRRLWCDSALSQSQIGKLLGVSQVAISKRGRRLDLPKIRPAGGRTPISDDALFREMWEGSVRADGMAKYFAVSERSIWRHADRLGLPKRAKSRTSITLADFLADRLRARLDAAATGTMAAMRMSGMVDRPRPHGGAK